MDTSFLVVVLLYYKMDEIVKLQKLKNARLFFEFWIVFGAVFNKRQSSSLILVILIFFHFFCCVNSVATSTWEKEENYCLLAIVLIDKALLFRVISMLLLSLTEPSISPRAIRVSTFLVRNLLSGLAP